MAVDPLAPLPDKPKRKGGMFGSGIGDAISAALNGYLAAGGNQAGIMGLQALHGRRQQERAQQQEAEQYQQRRQDGFQDWVQKQTWELANKPQGQTNDTVADFEYISKILGEDAAKEFLRNKTVAPPMMVTGPNGQMFMMPRSMPQMTPQGAPPGVTFTPLDEGGPTPQASGGFPRPFQGAGPRY
jgi:hypothetical protein